MCPKTVADFEPDVGGLFDDFDGTFIKVKFAEAPVKYSEASESKTPGIGLYLTFDQTYEKGGTTLNVEQFYSIGNPDNWEIVKEGSEVVNKKDPDKHAFNKNTNVWALVEKMIEHTGSGDAKKGLDFFIKRDHYMTQAAFYVGLAYHMKQQSVMNPVKKEAHDVLLPNKFLGEKKVETVSGGAETSDFDEKLMAFVSGKTTAEVKKGALKEFKGNSPYIREIVNGTKLADMEAAGLIAKDGDKYI